MGNGVSVDVPGGGYEGYQVLKVQPNSPDTSLTPSDHWGGDGLIGISVRFSSFEGACENVWHIL
eukprot:gene7173-9652_t